MDFRDLVMERYSVRQCDTTREIPEEDMQLILDAAVALLGLILIRTLPYYRPGSDAKGGRDIPGIATLILGIVSLQLYVTEGPQWGWVDVKSLGLLLTATIFILLFIGIERGAKHPFLDLRVFRNSVYSGATVANFLLNASTGIIIIVSSLLQLASGVPVDQVGLMSIGYGVSILLFIRVGEKLMQRYGARLPMLLSCATVAVALCLLLPTNAMADTYMTLVVIAYSLFGAGLGLFATASTDSALTRASDRYTTSGRRCSSDSKRKISYLCHTSKESWQSGRMRRIRNPL